MALSLHWRVLTRERSELDEPAVSFGPYGGPAWFDRDKLKEVGFDVTRLTDTDRGRNFYERHLPREALVVLELDGPAYQRSLAAVWAYGARQNALLAANPGRKEFEDRARRGKDLIEQEERDNSRLFVVDAGLDAAALRAKYPDTLRYAILHGRVRPSISWDSKKPELTGVVSELDVQEINVPARFRKHFAAAQRQYALPSASPFAATLAIGRRLEPWITALSPRAGEHGADVPDLRP